WKFPDSLIIYYFANAGLIGFFLLIIFVIIQIRAIFRIKAPFLLFLLVFLVVISFKGNFPMNNLSMFVFTLVGFLEVNKFTEFRSN
ncbi:hypothetical protein REH81_27705, partial [Vibrio rotiferianus]